MRASGKQRNEMGRVRGKKKTGKRTYMDSNLFPTTGTVKIQPPVYNIQLQEEEKRGGRGASHPRFITSFYVPQTEKMCFS